MSDSRPNFRRHFLSWDQPLPAQAAAWLARDWDGTGPLDLSRVLVIVPTRQSGRRLREALAAHAQARGSAVLAPRVVLPEDLPTPPPEAGLVASRLEAQLAWAELLREIDLAEWRAVFPVDPPVRNFAWAARLAAQFQRLQAALGESGLRFADVVGRAGAGMPEAERWAQLAALERRFDAMLARSGRRVAQAARIGFAAAPPAPAGVTRVVLLGTPDPQPLAVTVLEQWRREITVDVAIFGPEGEAALFDEWGRPLPEAWRRRPLALDFFTQVHLAADAGAQAERVADLVGRYGDPSGRLAIGVADAEVAPALESRLRSQSVPVFNPAGERRRRERLFPLLEALAALDREPAFETVQLLARCPDFLAWLATRGAPSPAAVLRELDEIHARHLPATIAGALAHTAKRPAARAALESARTLREVLREDHFAEAAAAALGTIFAGRRLADAAASESAEAWMEVLRAIAAARELGGKLKSGEWWEIALAQFGESLRFPNRDPGAVDLLGWLELLWEDAPHLVLTGCNDGRVPEAVAGDAFLPEALRQRLALKTNEERFARDAYLLAALAASRARGGRLDVLVGKVSAAGDPLRPSRLLLLCDDADLPHRVERLFGPAEADRAALPWRRAWQLRPPALPAPSRVSVTAFRDYLRCPFRFYLKHAARMERVDPLKSELDALDFGTLCHAALEAMGLDAAMRETTDVAALRNFLVGEIDRRARERYGAELTLPLIVQLESARQRLARAAEVQAAERAAGWRIEQVERKFELPLGGIVVSGKIDRIERHLDTGEVRVIDYKTSDQAVAAMAAHVRNARRAEDAPEWARLRVEGRDLVWTDLQLPLYLEALAPEFGEAVQAGYFNLPKAVGETALSLWDGYDAAWRAAARRCAEGVAAGVVSGIFWPPAEVPPADEDDAFLGLFHQGTAASVAWEGRR